MRISVIETTDTILKEIGKRIKQKRIALSITQKELANEADISLRSIVNVEKGENISIRHMISILKALRIVENLELLIPETKTDPYDILKLGKRRQRVSKRKNTTNGWKWGDEK